MIENDLIKESIVKDCGAFPFACCASAVESEFACSNHKCLFSIT
jgi:hypothetical protein